VGNSQLNNSSRVMEKEDLFSKRKNLTWIELLWWSQPTPNWVVFGAEMTL
jgi:hypothetical protein